MVAVVFIVLYSLEATSSSDGSEVNVERLVDKVENEGRIEHERIVWVDNRTPHDPVAQWYNMKDIVSVLERCGFDYRLAWGSLIGVVREGRFLDSDGDFDIAVHGEDFPYIARCLRETLPLMGFVCMRELNVDKALDETVEPLVSYIRSDNSYGDINALLWCGNTRRIRHVVDGVEATFRVPEDPECNLESIYGEWWIPRGGPGRVNYDPSMSIHPARQPFMHSEYGQQYATAFTLQDLEFRETMNVYDPDEVESGFKRPYCGWTVVTSFVSFGGEEVAVAVYPTGTYTIVSRNNVCGPVFYSSEPVTGIAVVGGRIRLFVDGKVYMHKTLAEMLRVRYAAPEESPYPVAVARNDD